MSWSEKIDARDGLENLQFGDGPRPYMTPQEQRRGEDTANAVSALSHSNTRYNAVMDMTPKPKGGRKSKSNKKAHSRRRKISKKSQTKKRK